MSVSVKDLILQSVFLPKVAQLCVLCSKANGTARFGHWFATFADNVKKGGKSISQIQKSSENQNIQNIIDILVTKIFCF